MTGAFGWGAHFAWWGEEEQVSCGVFLRNTPALRYIRWKWRIGTASTGRFPGILAALMEIESCLPILHGPAGCAFHYRRSMRTRLTPFFSLAATDLRDEDVVFGGEEKLVAALEKAAFLRPDLIAVLPSCVADVMQDDLVRSEEHTSELQSRL